MYSLLNSSNANSSEVTSSYTVKDGFSFSSSPRQILLGSIAPTKPRHSANRHLLSSPASWYLAQSVITS